MVASYCLSGGAGDPLVAFGGDGPRSYAELYASAPNTRSIARLSAASLWGVAVPWAFT